MELDPKKKSLFEQLVGKCYFPVLVHEKRLKPEDKPEGLTWTNDQSKVTCSECISWIRS